MKLKFNPKLVGTIGLTAGLMSLIVIGTTLHSVVAQAPTESSEVVQNPNAVPRLTAPPPGLAGIDLTPQQQAQIQKIHQELRTQYRAVVPRSNQPSTEQEAKLAQVEKACRDKVEAILTPEQLQQFRKNETNITLKPAIASGTMLPFELVGLDLSPQQQLQILEIEKEANSQVEAILPSRQVTTEQRAKMRQLMQSYRQQVEAVLTPEQQQKFRQNLQQWQPNQSN